MKSVSEYVCIVYVCECPHLIGCMCCFIFLVPQKKIVSIKDRLGAENPEEKLEQEKILVSGNNLTKTVYNPGLLAKKQAEAANEKIQVCTQLNELIKKIMKYQ